MGAEYRESNTEEVLLRAPNIVREESDNTSHSIRVPFFSI
jgi:hypothetical protein